jgi:hypothetical protein
MTVRLARRFRAWPTLTVALMGLYACTSDGNVAGGSSEVDNPQVLVALVDESGNPKPTTGSLGIFLADQSPALNPTAKVEVNLNGASSVKLTSALLTAAGLTDGTRIFNLFLQGEDSTGSFLQNLTYNPASLKFSLTDTTTVTQVSLTVSRLIRSESVLMGGTDSTGLNRLIIPGSPFQAVLVDSIFVFDEIPAGIFPVHLITPDGVEIPLPEPVNTSDPKYHSVNLDTTPVVRPPPPPPVATLRIQAGDDKTANIGTEFYLVGEVSGISPNDRRLAVRWRQLSPNDHDARAIMERASSLRTRVSFPRPGVYTFVIEGNHERQSATDTVVIGVQAPQLAPAFYEPNAYTWAFADYQVNVVWFAHSVDTLDIEFSRDSAATWQTVMGNTPSGPGFNQRWWIPQGPASDYCFLRLRAQNGSVLAVSQRFALWAW